MADDIRGNLLTFIRTELARGVTDVDVEKESLIETGVIDSVGIMKLVDHLETAFGVSISDDELLPDNFEDLDTITELVRSKRS